MYTGGAGLTTGGGGGEGTGTEGEGGRGAGTKGLHLNELQSTGLDKKDLHWAADRCAGLAGRQLRRSSKAARLRHTGGSPVKKLYENVKFSSLGSRQMLCGILPER